MWLHFHLPSGYKGGTPTMEVGVRELRNNLSRYLDRVRGGEEVIVTDRGHAIARVLPLGTERVLDRLIAEGVVTPAQRPKRGAGKPIRSEGTVSDLVADQRR
jgi:prevent-host-death family protein